MTQPQSPAETRAFKLYYARVLLREARARKGPFAASLLEWAGKARREALAIDVSPKQPDLFARMTRDLAERNG